MGRPVEDVAAEGFGALVCFAGQKGTLWTVLGSEVVLEFTVGEAMAIASFLLKQSLKIPDFDFSKVGSIQLRSIGA